MVAGAAGAGPHEEPGFQPVPRLRIVTVEEALDSRDDAFRTVKEQDRDAQGRLDL